MSAGESITEQMDAVCERISRLERSRPAIDAHDSDQRWDCERCGQLLGLVDKSLGRIRLQVREFNVQFTPADGTATSTRCKRCGWDNAMSLSG